MCLRRPLRRCGDLVRRRQLHNQRGSYYPTRVVHGVRCPSAGSELASENSVLDSVLDISGVRLAALPVSKQVPGRPWVWLG